MEFYILLNDLDVKNKVYYTDFILNCLFQVEDIKTIRDIL